jgi:hypothetical protein
VNHLLSLLNRTPLYIEGFALLIQRTTLSVAHATLLTATSTCLSGNISRKSSQLGEISQKLGTGHSKVPVTRKPQILEVFYSFPSWWLQKRYIHQSLRLHQI